MGLGFGFCKWTGERGGKLKISKAVPHVRLGFSVESVHGRTAASEMPEEPAGEEGAGGEEAGGLLLSTSGWEGAEEDGRAAASLTAALLGGRGHL